MSLGAQPAVTLPVDAKGLANCMLDWAEGRHVPVTPLKLQKLLYFCHADYLVQFNKNLLKQEFEAWDYGPVIPSIYQEFKADRSKPISTRAFVFDPMTATRRPAVCSLPLHEENVLRPLFEFYCRFSAEQLSDLSHTVEGPWRQARSLFTNGLNMDRRIPADLIRRHHRVIHD